MKNRIRECRKEAGMSQMKLGMAVGVSGKAISHYENGIREPKLAMLEKLSHVLDVIPAFLVGWSDKPYCQVIESQTDSKPLTEQQKNCPYRRNEEDK